ncbi:thiamine pyrophosphate-binding protein [Sphingobium cloacae]|uniref:Thiamine pyrophosphate-binding protein n=1 Tax=Sphingobium cloacae TaxID=120107 RepID=A0A1E1F0A6_9SPHN|nr:thiamine pyrophosphate-binding protein [Sphingobium cloacae]BAV63947.1 thiamine pyrophosphate-binding protein [Sphingobium cloacae]
MSAAKGRNAAQCLVRQLEIHGIDHIFCVPGESYLAVLDALIGSPIKVTVCRAEGGAAMMAEAHGKLTGRPAACFVTRGPGAANAMPGLHIAQHDSTPMLVFVGQVERDVRDRGAFQELDYRAVFGSIAKWVAEIDNGERIPEIVSRAVHAAMSGRPGPVLVSLPEDMLRESVEAGDAVCAAVVEAHPGAGQMARLGQLLGEAKRPLAILGGSRWSQVAVDQVAAFAGRWDLPVAVSFRRQMLFPASHDSFAGDLGFGANPKLAARVRDADLLLLIGARMAEVPSQGYGLISIPEPEQRIVHVHPDPSELGKLYRPVLAINAAPEAFAAALEGVGPVPSPSPSRADFREAGRADFLAWTDPERIVSPGDFHPARMMAWLREKLPRDAILCNGAGNYATWVHRFHRFERFGTQLAPTSGSMGYGVPAAVAAKRMFPERAVIAFAGDGCFMMNGQEFATAVQYGLAIIVILIDNGMYGTIRMHQEREFPGRPIATALTNPDFAAYARAFGGHGETVARTSDFADAFDRASASGKPAILHCLLDPDAISPGTTLEAVRHAAFEVGR